MLGAVAALLASTLLACGTVEPAATPTGGSSLTHTDTLDSIAVMGHRFATGAQSDPASAFSSAPENVWATGDNPEVQSVYQRLLATHPALKGHNVNVAQDVATVTDVERQFDQVPSMQGIFDGYWARARRSVADTRGASRMSARSERYVWSWPT